MVGDQIHITVDVSTNLWELCGMQSQILDNDRFSPEFRSFITFRLGKTTNLLNAQAAHILRKHSDLSLTEWRIISLINAVDETTASEIVKTTFIDKGQISRTVRSLANKGLVLAKQRESSRRQMALKLSPDGKALHRRVVAIMANRQRHLTSEFTDDELAAFHAALDKLDRASRMRDFDT